MKINDNFIYQILTTKQARQILGHVDLDIFALYEDGAEALITTREELDELIIKGIEVGLSVGHVNPSQLFQNEAQRIADKFRENIAQELGKGEREHIDKTNAYYRSIDEKICATHDFLDANVPMSEAFKSVTGREIELQNQEDVHLWNRAWKTASINGFASYPNRQPLKTATK
jgi:hypothetical protein